MASLQKSPKFKITMFKKYFKTIFASILSLFLFNTANAQKASPVAKSVLWEISGKDIKTSYLFGTIHLIPKDDFLLDDPTKKSFDAAEQVVFEIDMKALENPMALMGMMGKMMMSGDTTIKDLISDADYKLLKVRMDSLGIPLEMMQSIKPMFLSTMLDGAGAGFGGMDDANSESAKTTGFEIEFNKMAKSKNKSTSGLETVDFQMSLFDSIPLKVQADMLVASLKTKNSGKGEFQEMVKLYLDRDIEKMSGMLSSDKSSDNSMAPYEAMMLNNRNANWISKMEKLMRDKSNFFAVGAAHLGGVKGVLNLLKLKGYTVKPLQGRA